MVDFSAVQLRRARRLAQPCTGTSRC